MYLVSMQSNAFLIREKNSIKLKLLKTESNMVSSQIYHEIQADQPLVIECTTVPPHLPVDYCRFVLPDGTGFSINEKATSQK